MTRMMFLGLWMVLISCGSKTSGQQNSYQLSPTEFEAKFQADPNAQIVDVRTPNEYSQGCIKQAVNIDYQGSEFSTEIAKLDKNKATFIYCHSGKRSAESYKIMKELGFKEVYELKGGMSNWQKENKPVEKN